MSGTIWVCFCSRICFKIHLIGGSTHTAQLCSGREALCNFANGFIIPLLLSYELLKSRQYLRGLRIQIILQPISHQAGEKRANLSQSEHKRVRSIDAAIPLPTVKHEVVNKKESHVTYML